IYTLSLHDALPIWRNRRYVTSGLSPKSEKSLTTRKRCMIEQKFQLTTITKSVVAFLNLLSNLSFDAPYRRNWNYFISGVTIKSVKIACNTLTLSRTEKVLNAIYKNFVGRPSESF